MSINDELYDAIVCVPEMLVSARAMQAADELGHSLKIDGGWTAA